MGSCSEKVCPSFGRSWRITSNCLQSLRLVMIVMVLYHLHCSFANKYSHNAGTFTLFDCGNNTDWCGEEWRANRVLRYNYSVTDVLMVGRFVQEKHEYNCTGAQSSLDCQHIHTVENITRPGRNKTIVRKLANITNLPARSLYLITTDNINESTSISDTYPLNQDKIWQFHVPKGCKMIVYFSQFDLEISEKCKSDSFSVQTSRKQKEIHRYCNNLHKIEIKRRRVQMTFHSNDAVAKGGIKASVCLSNYHNTDSGGSYPCSCDSNSQKRRRRRRRDVSQISSAALNETMSSSRLKQEQEEAQVGVWLETMMTNGPRYVDSIISKSSNPKLKFLAKLYRESLRMKLKS